MGEKVADTKISKKISKRELDDQLEQALEQTFPASDPIAIGAPTSVRADRPMHRRAPLLDKYLVKSLAARVGRKLRQPSR